MSQMQESLAKNQVHNLDRIKPKDLYKMAYGDLKFLNQQKKQLQKTMLIVVVAIEIVLGAITLGSEAAPIFFFLNIFVAIGVGLFYYSKKQSLGSRFKRISLLGLISKSLRRSSYKISAFFDTRDKTDRQFNYRTTRSPYSRSIKRYHYQPYLMIDTNLKNMNPRIDGVKFKLESFLKTKTKGGSVIREIITIKIKFFFRIGHSMSQQKYMQLLEELNYAAQVPRYYSEVYIIFPSPADDIICFKLKLIMPMKAFVPSSIPPIVQDFFNDIQNSYRHAINQPLYPVKTSEQIEYVVDEQEKQATFEYSEVAAKEIQDNYMKPVVEAKSDLDPILDNLKITLDQYTKSMEDGSTVVTFNPQLNYFKQVVFRISDLIQMEFVSRDKVRKQLHYTIDVMANQLIYFEESDEITDDLLQKYRIRQFLEEARANGTFESIIVRTSPDFEITILINSGNNDIKQLETGVNFAKSLLQEMKFLY